MGSPLACILANIFMECFESELLSLFPLQPAIWLRYVDDIFIIWPHGIEYFQSFLDSLNQLIPSIKFTTEWESINENTGIATLPFLDILIHRSPHKVTFSVYRKPSHSQVYIHYFSNHAPHVKKGLLGSLFLRALRISSSEHLQSEFDTLWSALRRIGYPEFFIREALSSAKTRLNASPPTLSNQTNTPTTYYKTISVPYHPTFSKLTRFMKSSNFKICYNSRNSIGKSVVSKKGRVNISSQNRSGVYQIPCSPGCDKIYYGRTMKPLYKRIREHNTYLQDQTRLKATVEHQIAFPGHKFDTSAARLIWQSNNEYECQFVEASCIKSLTNCNISTGDIKVSPAIASLVASIVVSHRSKGNGNNSLTQRTSLYKSPLASGAPILPSTPTPATDITSSRPTLNLTATSPTSPRVQPPPSSPMTPTLPLLSVSTPDTFVYISPIVSPASSRGHQSPIFSLSSDQWTQPTTTLVSSLSSHSVSTPRIIQSLPRPQRISSRNSSNISDRPTRFLSQPTPHSELLPVPNSGNIPASQPTIRLLNNDISKSVNSPLRTRNMNHKRP